MNIPQQQKRSLKQKCHHLKPVVIVGSNGLTENVLNEIGVALFAHELIKIKISSGDREERAEIQNKICEFHSADLIQAIGSTISIYKANPEK